MDEKDSLSDAGAGEPKDPSSEKSADIVSDSESKSDETSELSKSLDNHVDEESGSAAVEEKSEEPGVVNETEGEEDKTQDSKSEESEKKPEEDENEIEDSENNPEDSENKSEETENKTEDSEIKPEECENKIEDSDPKSPVKSIDSSFHEESSQEATDSLPVDSLAVDTDKDVQETSTQDMSTDKDDVENPQFENVPEMAEEPQEDHSQALDPFDALLKDTPAQETSSSATQIDAATNDDDDDHNADDDAPAEADESTEHVDAEDEPAIPPEEPGADEEVMLLPDTEREISEADKAEAEKVLAEKRKLAEASASEAMVPKEENETKDPEDTEVANEEAAAANVDEDAGESQENGEKDQDDAAEEDETTETAEKPSNVISEVFAHDATCLHCGLEVSCKYQLTVDGASRSLCSETCLKQFQLTNDQYTVNIKKYHITEITPAVLTCSECEEEKLCYFFYNYDGEDTHYCSMICLRSMMADEVSKYTFQRKRITVNYLDTPVTETCTVCEEVKECLLSFERYGENLHACDVDCIRRLNGLEQGRYSCKSLTSSKKKKQSNPPLLKLKVISNATDKYLDEAYKVTKTPSMIQAAREERERTFIRTCVQCNAMINNDEKNLSWETMDFCNEGCLGVFQNKIGARCTNCKSVVSNTSLGKYCVRFGYDIRQFCKSGCLEEFKKGLKICCYCQKDISAGHQGFLAPVGDKGQFKDFCTQACMEKFDQMSKNATPPAVWAKCAVCSLEKATTIEVEQSGNSQQRLCSDPCFAAFKFVNNIHPDQCRWCKKYFERCGSNAFTIYENAAAHVFCSKACINVYISNSRHIVPCSWCKVKKYNFDMIRRAQSHLMLCSLNCLNLYQVSVNAVSSRRIKCDMCSRTSLAQYHLTMSDATVRNFCTYQCVMGFQGQYSSHAPPLLAGAPAPAAVPAGAPRRTAPAAPQHKNNLTPQKSQQRTSLPVISNVQSLAAPPPLAPQTRKKRNQASKLPPPEPEPPAPAEPPPPPPKPLTPPPPPPPKIYNHVLVKTLPPAEVANKATMTKPMTVSKGVSCRPHPCTKECQTDSSLERRILIPVPVPIYVPVPCAMWSIPFPIPVPIPIPVPCPVFIPTTRNSAKGIMKEINKIHDKMPTDPFEAELLMMAEMVAGDKKKDQSDSDTDDDNPAAESGFSPVGNMDGNAAFGEDMLQMALKMATEYEEQPVDLESAMTASTITPSHPGMSGLEGDAMHHHHMMVLEQQRAVAALRASAAPRKRQPQPQPPQQSPRNTRGKRRRAEPAPAPEPPREPAEKPDANMCLKYTFGVNAWKQWVMTKNAEIEKSSIRRKPFKSEILQLTADELNYSLCLFVKEVRKPNGSEYAPDTIYYLVLGIQQYLFENGRIDNIFTDPYYEKFTDCLDEVARKFSVLYNDSQYIVTRVEEEHLWESKQLGAHSPHVLLSTLMFFNTKHFNLVTVDEHMQLSFSHIMKHWKRNPNQPGQAKLPGSRNVLLRFYPPQSALEANSRKKKVYEQQENEENPLRCPVKLYEFYISKCPESVRTRNDVFYLQPERSCVPDSPVWYSTQPLSRAALAKMLHRVKMVKEINIALLTS